MGQVRSGAVVAATSAGGPQHRTNVLIVARNTTAARGVRTAVGTDLRSLAVVVTRTVAMLLIATLLILVLLPAALAANGA